MRSSDISDMPAASDADAALSRSDVARLRLSPALQQPDWCDPALVEQVRGEIAALPELVAEVETRRLRALLAEVARGERAVVQAGDCAEDFAECTPTCVARKAELVHAAADALAAGTGTPVVRVGRIAGQFAKPRSCPVERIGDVELPVYRGHMVNGPEPHAGSRDPDPKRLLSGYWAATAAMDGLRRANADRPDPGQWLWTSHEALLLDYELPMVRRAAAGARLLTSTHWPWVGDRTRQLDGAHIALLAEVSNPIACKVGPGTSAAELVRLCARLDPDRVPGRLTLIARMGASAVEERLGELVAAVRAAGHPVIWLCDPMHGNTVSSPSGRKTRVVDELVVELGGFLSAVTGAGGVPGGLHLETTPEDVTECVASRSDLGDEQGAYTSLCDPRLNFRQAVAVASCWSTEFGLAEGSGNGHR